MEQIKMTPKQKTNIIRSFNFEGKELTISFVETVQVTEGVECDVYKFVDDSSKDLGIIRISAGGKTPLQKVLRGDKTIEGYVSGKGRLTVTKVDGQQVVYAVGGESKELVAVTVEIGETMQWEADERSELTAYEVCFPPYEDGRYENLTLRQVK